MSKSKKNFNSKNKRVYKKADNHNVDMYSANQYVSNQNKFDIVEKTLADVFTQFINEHPEITCKPEWLELIECAKRYNHSEMSVFCRCNSRNFDQEFFTQFKDILDIQKCNPLKMSEDFLIEMYDKLSWTKDAIEGKGVTGRKVIEQVIGIGNLDTLLVPGLSTTRIYNIMALCGVFSIAL